MKKYLLIVKNSVMVRLVYRFHIFFMSLSNAFYIFLTYFLWKAIYQDNQLLNGMTFNQVFVYLALASSIFTFFLTWTEWAISEMVISGNIISELVKPVDFQLRILCEMAGMVICNLFTVMIPALLVIFFVFQSEIILGQNIIFFFISLTFAYLINFNMDYLAGVTSFYTESLWGISLTKETIILLFSGGIIPLAFFPNWMESVLVWTPFQAIYHIPLSIITSVKLDSEVYLKQLLIQVIWVFILFGISRLFFRIAVKEITINGG